MLNYGLILGFLPFQIPKMSNFRS